MKKELTALLLAAGLMTSSLIACNRIPPNGDDINTTTTTTEKTEKDPPAGGEEVGEKIYYKIEKIELTTVRYTIYDAKGNVVLTEQTDRPLEISMLGEKVVDICIGMGTGLSVHKYYNVEENCFSQEYTYVAAATENLVAYIDGSSLEDRKLVVRDIFDAELFCREFALDFSETMTNPLIEARFTNDEIGLDLAYYTEKTPVKVTQTLPILSDYTENQKFYLVYWSNGDGTCSVSAKGDSIVEAVIPPVSPFGERVTTLTSMSFYACKKLKSVVLPSSIQFINGGLAFEGCDSLSSVVYQGTAEQWQAIKGVDQLSFDFDILFAPEQMITEEQAVELARNFWSNFLEDTETKYIVVPVANIRWDKSVHVIMLKWLVYFNGEPSHYSTVDEIWVDKTTGELRYPSAGPKPDGPDYIYYVPPITEKGDFASYEGIIKLYRNVVHDFAGTNYGEQKESSLASNLGITDEREKEWLRAISSSGFLFYDGRGEGGMPQYKLTCGYAIKDLNGDGIDELVLLNDSYMIVAIFSMVDGKPILLDNYIPRGSCWIGGDGLLHVDGSGGADISSHTVYRISEGGGSLETIIEFGLNGHEWIGDIAVTKYYRVIDGEEVAITKEECRELDAQYGKYLGVYEGASATKEYSGLQFTPLFTEAEIAQQTYDGVLCNQIKVYDDLRGRYEYLKDCTTPYMQTPLYKIKDSLRYAYQDLDGDGMDELIIDCGDTLILRYYKGTVFLYDFTFRNLYCLNTDGSYCWNHTGQSFEYGMKQLYFEGSELKSKVLYRVVDNIAFYIGEACVSEKALQDYIDANPKKEVTFTPLTIAAEWDTLPSPSFGK